MKVGFTWNIKKAEELSDKLRSYFYKSLITLFDQTSSTALVHSSHNQAPCKILGSLSFMQHMWARASEEQSTPRQDSISSDMMNLSLHISQTKLPFMSALATLFLIDFSVCFHTATNRDRFSSVSRRTGLCFNWERKRRDRPSTTCKFRLLTFHCYAISHWYWPLYRSA
jgi:hypothetical protein